LKPKKTETQQQERGCWGGQTLQPRGRGRNRREVFGNSRSQKGCLVGEHLKDILARNGEGPKNTKGDGQKKERT